VVYDMPIFSKRKGDSVKKFYDTSVEKGEVAILYLGLSGILIRVMSRTIALDVADLLGEEGISEIRGIDLLLYTHAHYDHYNRKACIDIVERTGAKVLAESKAFSDLRGRVPGEGLVEASPGQTYRIGELDIEAIRGIHVGPIVLYMIEIGGIRIFHGGDSGYIKLKGRRADLAFLPTGSPSPTASPNDAFKMVADLKPRIAVPIHGSKQEHESFMRLVEREFPVMRVEVIEDFNPLKVEI
jgi:L-ascorbate metabolism protein UlaG (beta-lactamase superfamily)